MRRDMTSLTYPNPTYRPCSCREHTECRQLVVISRITFLPLIFAFPAGITVSCAFHTPSDKSPDALAAFPLYCRGISDTNS